MPATSSDAIFGSLGRLTWAERPWSPSRALGVVAEALDSVTLQRRQDATAERQALMVQALMRRAAQASVGLPWAAAANRLQRLHTPGAPASATPIVSGQVSLCAGQVLLSVFRTLDEPPGTPARIDLEIDGDCRVLVVDCTAKPGGLARTVEVRVPAGAHLVRAALNGLEMHGSPLVLRREAMPCPPPRQTSDCEVWVVVPVFGAADALRACLDSLSRARCQTSWRALLVDDCSAADPGLEAVLAQYTADARFSLVRRTVNGGFAAAVNTALRVLGARDVVLLNSDTLVSDGWIDRLRGCAHRAPNIGAANPLSNCAELLSVPLPMRGNALPDLERLRQINGELMRRAGMPLDLPAGVGFCWYIRGAALAAAGLLDEASIDRGYGEDTEFSLRLQRKGWRTVAAPDVYVAHAGSQSFGGDKTPLAAANNALLRQRFPEHARDYQRFLDQGALEAVSAALQRNLLRQGIARGASLRLTDGRSWQRRALAGVGAAWGVVPVWRDAEWRGCELLAHGVAGFGRLEYVGTNATERLVADLIAAGFAEWVRESFADWPLALTGALDAAATAARRRSALVDASAYCPRRVPGQAANGLCAEPEPLEACIACVSAHGPRMQGVENLAVWRAATAASLAGSAGRHGSLVATDAELATRLQRRLGRRVAVVATPRQSARSTSAPVRRIALLDLSLPERGLDLVEALARAWSRSGDPRRLVVWGRTTDDRRLARFACVDLPGAAEPDPATALAELGCDALADASALSDGLDAALAAHLGLAFISRQTLESWLAATRVAA